MDKADKKQDKKMMVKAVHTHESALHPKQSKTPVSKFAKGGKTDMDMMKYGRGMAKVMNQKSGRGG
jgi:hypothetical protein